MANITIEEIRTIFESLKNYPIYSARKRAQIIGISRATIQKYESIANQHNLNAEDVVSMTDSQLTTTFNIHSRNKEFIEPDFEVIRQYLETPRAWAKKLNTIANAWRYKYVKVNFPNYVNGELPMYCMSLRTFTRKYNEYLEKSGIEFMKRQPNYQLNFGAGSVVEIDTIGNLFPYIDSEGNLQRALLFTGVLKYSGLAFMMAIPNGTTMQWGRAIIEMLWSFGGVPQVLRSDNDKAICNYGNSRKGTKTKLKPDIQAILNSFNIIGDLCPIRSPKYKGACECLNGIVQRGIFAEQIPGTIPQFNDLDALNKAIAIEMEKFNAAPRSNNQLSRKSTFDLYEAPYLSPLPLVKPTYRRMSLISVNDIGFLKFDHHFYFVGPNYIGKQVIVENILGETLKIMDNNYKEIYRYPIDHDKLSPAKYHKPDSMKSEKEKIISRDKDWFINEFNQFGYKAFHIIRAIKFIFKNLNQSIPIATRKCNGIYNLYEKNKDKILALNLACKQALVANDIDKIIEQIRDLFMAFKDLDISYKDEVIETVTSDDIAHSDSLRGGKAFED